MRRQGRQSAIVPHASIDPGLEMQWQDALLSRPDSVNATALAAWNREHGDLLATYQQAVAKQTREAELQARAAKAQTRRRRRFGLLAATVVTSIAVAVSAIVHQVNRPSEDELRRRELLSQDAACTAHYQQAHRLKLVSKQIDLLKEGEGGWIELYTLPGETPIVGSLNLSPAELQAGKVGKANVDHEAYVYDSTPGIGNWAILERRGGRLVLTLFFSSAGFGELPHAPLHANTTTTVVVRGEKLSPAC